MNNIKTRATAQITVSQHPSITWATLWEVQVMPSPLSRHRPGLRGCKNTSDGSVRITAVVFSRLKVVISSLLFSFTLFIALLIPVLHGCAHHEIIPQHAPGRILLFHFYRLLISRVSLRNHARMLGLSYYINEFNKSKHCHQVDTMSEIK